MQRLGAAAAALVRSDLPLGGSADRLQAVAVHNLMWSCHAGMRRRSGWVPRRRR